MSVVNIKEPNKYTLFDLLHIFFSFHFIFIFLHISLTLLVLVVSFIYFFFLCLVSFVGLKQQLISFLLYSSRDFFSHLPFLWQAFSHRKTIPQAKIARRSFVLIVSFLWLFFLGKEKASLEFEMKMVKSFWTNCQACLREVKKW